MTLRKFEAIYLKAAPLALTGILLAVHAQAQDPVFDDTTPALAARGTTPTGVYSINQIETINTVTGNLTLRIPITKLAPGRAGTTSGLNLVYNSQVYSQYLYWEDDAQHSDVEWHNLASPTGGWKYEWDYNYYVTMEELPRSSLVDQCASPIYGYIYSEVLYFPDGSRHPLHLINYSDVYTGASHNGYYRVAPGIAACGDAVPSGNLTYYTTDGTYISVIILAGGNGWQIIFPDGRQVFGSGANATSTLDGRNPINSVTFTSTVQNNAAIVYQYDWSGRSIALVHWLTALAPGQTLSDGVSQQGFGGQGLVWGLNWILVDPSSQIPSATPCIQQQATGLYQATKYNDCLAVSSLGQAALTSIILPPGDDGNPLSYQFGYETNGWGTLNSVTLPTGSTVSYTYAGYFWPLFLNPVASKTVTWQDFDVTGNPIRTELSRYLFGFTSSSFTAPDGGTVSYQFYNLNTPGWQNGLVYSVTQPDGTRLDRTWQQNQPISCSGNDPCNPYARYEFHTAVTSGTPNRTAATVHVLDQNGNQTCTAEYDWSTAYSGDAGRQNYIQSFLASYTAVRTTTNSYSLSTSQEMATPCTPGTPSDNANGYWHLAGVPAPSRPLDLLMNSTIAVGSAPASITAYLYGNTASLQFDPTRESHWDNQTSNYLNTNYTYDMFGNRTSVTAPPSVAFPNGIKTSYTYDSNSLCVTRKVAAAGQPNQRTFNYGACDFSTNLAPSETDADHNVTRSFVYDKFGRVTQTTETGGSLSRSKVTAYWDSIGYIADLSDLNALNDWKIFKSTWYDPLGRVRQTAEASYDGTTPTYTVQTLRYSPPDPLTQACGTNHVYQAVSNPIGGVFGDTTLGWTRTAFDQNGRPVEVQHIAGSGLPCPWGSNGNVTGTSTISYASNSTTTTDEAGVSQTSYVDGLGRLTQVTENSLGASTYYTYDALDDLLSVTPASGTGRSFTYSSLRRLITAGNPESGTTTYTYDSDGNLATRTSGGITTTYTYNELDELTDKTYSDSTPAAHYTYNKGWLTQTSSGTTSYQNTQFDGLGRVTAATQTTSSTPYPFTYTYNLLDEVTSMTMPSQRVVTTTYDSLGRPVGLSGRVGSTTTPYVSSVSYAPHGAPQQISLGNTLTEQTCFNNMLQPFVIRQRSGTAASCQTGTASDGSDVGYFSYSFSATQNNGNVTGQAIHYSASGSFSAADFQQSYTYTIPSTGNGVSRLMSATESRANNTPWTQQFNYDLVGNRWLTLGGMQVDPLTPTANQYDANNHLTTAAYNDGRGNVNQLGGYAYQYDAENRLISSTLTNNGQTLASATYGYDADGRRVVKQSGGATTQYVYDVQGNLAAEYTTYPVGGVVPTAPCTTCYLMADHLGSTRMLTDSGGNQKVLYDYAPFGEELTTQNGRDARWGGAGSGLHFTGKEQEGYEGDYLHYFGARYISAGQGRWTSPDKINLTSKRLLNPSDTLNKYAYAANNPLKYVDSTGDDITVFYKQGLRGFPLSIEVGHMALTAIDQSTGKTATLSFYPTVPASALTGTVPSYSLEVMDPHEVAQEGFSSLTIRTSPEEAQKVIAWIGKFRQTGPPFNLLSSNCTTSCVEALRILGLGVDPDIWNPDTLWDALFAKHGNGSSLPTLGHYPAQPGREYGNPRYPGITTFQLSDLYYRLWLSQMSIQRQPVACVEVTDSATGTRSKTCN